MKIVSIGPAYPLRGGIAKLNETLASNLKQQGHELVLYSYKYQYPSILFPGKTQFSETASGPDLKIKKELHSVNFFTWRKAANKIVNEEPDLIIIHYWMPFFAPQLNTILKILQKKKTKIILLAHNLIPHEKQPGTVFFTRRLLNKISGLVCLSSSVKMDALSLRPDLPCMVLPHPIYNVYGEKVSKIVATTKLKLENQFQYILFFGLIRAYKGLDLLLQSIPLLKNKNVRIIVAGEFYEKEEDYHKIVDELDINEKLIFRKGFIPDEEVKFYFSAADLVVQPYRTATQSGVTQIAYHFGLPMIVTNVGGLPEIVDHGKTGYVVETKPQSIAGAINLYFEEEKKDEFSLNVEKRAEDFSWETFIEKLLAFSSGL